MKQDQLSPRRYASSARTRRSALATAAGIVPAAAHAVIDAARADYARRFEGG